jgi:protein O-GlcNAc transferase
VDAGALIFACCSVFATLSPHFQCGSQILRAVPNSYLWLMEPGDSGGSESTTKAALLRSVAAEGVAAQRVLFAPRAAKARHIHRHAAADLFLDTIVYGAHSTATDALRGVRPRGNLILTCVAMF